MKLLCGMQHPWLAQQGLASDKPLDSVVLTRMAKFAAMNKLKKAALLVAAKQLSEAEITGLSNLFKSIDTDNSGTITVDEMRQACAKMGSHFQARARLARRRVYPVSQADCGPHRVLRHGVLPNMSASSRATAARILLCCTSKGRPQSSGMLEDCSAEGQACKRCRQVPG